MPHSLLVHNRRLERLDRFDAALQRRLRINIFYIRFDHPSVQREQQILELQSGNGRQTMHRQVAGLARALRGWSLEKPPSIAEMLDLAQALELLGIREILPEHRDLLLPLIAKTEADRQRLLLQDGFGSLVADSLRFTSDRTPLLPNFENSLEV